MLSTTARRKDRRSSFGSADAEREVADACERGRRDAGERDAGEDAAARRTFNETSRPMRDGSSALIGAASSAPARVNGWSQMIAVATPKQRTVSAHQRQPIATEPRSPTTTVGTIRGTKSVVRARRMPSPRTRSGGGEKKSSKGCVACQLRPSEADTECQDVEHDGQPQQAIRGIEFDPILRTVRCHHSLSREMDTSSA